MNNLCPVCHTVVSKDERCPGGKSAYELSCPRCGDYELTDTARASLESIFGHDERKRAVLSYVIRKRQGREKRVSISYEDAKRATEQTLPSIEEQRHNVILWLGKNVTGPGEYVSLKPQTHQSVVGALSKEGFGFILKYLLEDDLIVGDPDGLPDWINTYLTYKGWKYFDELERGIRSSKKAFMAMKFDNLLLNKVVDEVFRAAVRQTGFDLFPADEMRKAGLVDDQIRVEIRTSRFLIADLTDESAGAYWEAGYAEGLGKPVIYSCEKKKFEEHKTHFDTNHHLTVLWDSENPKQAGEDLKATIRATLPDEAKLQDD